VDAGIILTHIFPYFGMFTSLQ